MVSKKTPPSRKMPRGIPSTTPMKMPSRALPPSTTPRQPPLVKGKSKQANAGTPKLGGELPAFKTTMTAKPRMPAPRVPAPRFMSTGEPSSSKYVQRSARENIGTPGTKNYVQRAARENIGMPNSSKFVQRTK